MVMKKILLLLVLSFTTPTYSQLFEAWVNSYNGPGNNSDIGKSVSRGDSGNVYVTGHSNNPVTFYDIVTIKYNEAGIKQWERVFNGPGSDVDYAACMLTDEFENVYVAGYTFNAGSQYDYVILKYNWNGNLEWSRIYNGPGNGIDQARSLFVDNSGSVYVTGHSYGGSGVSYDYATVKYSWDGNLQWVKRYNGPVSTVDGANAVYVDGSQNVYVTGQSSGDGSSYDAATVKYGADGTELWSLRYNGVANDIDMGFFVSSGGQGTIVIAGYSRGMGSDYDYVTIKIDESGNELWTQRYNGPLNKQDFPTDLLVDASGNVYVTGVADSDISEIYSNYATIKYNAAGVPQWAAIYNGPGNGKDSAASIALDDTGNVFVTGKSLGSGTSSDYATIKYTSSGVQDKVARYNGTGNKNDGANSISVDKFGNVYVTGTSFGSGGNDDHVTLRYSYVSGVNDPNGFVADNFILHQNYPNPFNPSTVIEYEVPAGSSGKFVQLNVYDVSGKLVASLVNKNQGYGSYSVSFNGSSLSSGVYLYNLVADGKVFQSKRMILSK